jgi:peptidoglycan LD-endopeptidase CwlK
MADPNTLLSKINPVEIYPIFLMKVKLVLQNCSLAGSDYFVISGLRSFQEQGDLYAQGRTVNPGSGVVTNAKPGFSAHNYGVAVDGCKDANMTRAGLQPDWNLADYQLWADKAREQGLEAGWYWTTFKEGPHIQLPLKAHKLTWDKLIGLNATGGTPLVWAEFDKHDWSGNACPTCGFTP